MNETHQSQLLEIFLSRLRRDPDAAPPAGLDPSLAAFARLLIQSAPPDDALRARIWRQALDSAHGGRLNGKTYRHIPEEHSSMLANPTLPPVSTARTTRAANPLPLLAAVIAVMLIGALLLTNRPGGPNDDQGASPIIGQIDDDAQRDATAEPAVTPLPTAVPPADGAIIIESGVMAPGFPADPSQVIVIQSGEVVEGAVDAESPVAYFVYTATRTGPVYPLVSGTGYSVFVMRPDAALQTQLDVFPATPMAPVAGVQLDVLPVPSLVPFEASLGAPVLPPAFGSIFLFSGDQVYLAIANPNPVTTMPFSIRLFEADAIPLGIGDVAENGLNSEVPLAYYTVNAEASSLLSVEVEGVDGFDTRLTVVDADGVILAQDEDGGPGINPEIYQLPLPTAGTYGIIVEPADDSEGRFSLTVNVESVE